MPQSKHFPPSAAYKWVPNDHNGLLDSTESQGLLNCASPEWEKYEWIILSNS